MMPCITQKSVLTLYTIFELLLLFFAGLFPQKLMRNFSSTEFPEPAETGNRPRAPAVTPTIPPPPPDSPPPLGVGGTSPIVIRAEEALIVLLVLVLWIAAIALFFNRWGKIRMLEPYQPKFQQQHRSSCPMVDINGPIGLQVTVIDASIVVSMTPITCKLREAIKHDLEQCRSSYLRYDSCGLLIVARYRELSRGV